MLIAVLVVLALFSLASIVKNKRSETWIRRNRKRTRKVMVVWGSGGHSAEMRQLLRSLLTKSRSTKAIQYTPRVHVYAKTDTLSRDKAMQVETEMKSDANVPFEY